MKTKVKAPKPPKVISKRIDGSLIYKGVTRKLIDLDKATIDTLKKVAKVKDTTVKDLIEKIVKEQADRYNKQAEQAKAVNEYLKK